jgi:hypothetical protein
MFIDILWEQFPRSAGAASVCSGGRSYGANTCVGNSFYKHHAPPERKTGKTCVDTNAAEVARLY